MNNQNEPVRKINEHGIYYRELTKEQTKALEYFYQVTKLWLSPESPNLEWRTREQIAYAWIRVKFEKKHNQLLETRFKMVQSVGTDKKFFNWLSTTRFKDSTEICNALLNEVRVVVITPGFISEDDYQNRKDWILDVLSHSKYTDPNVMADVFASFVVNFLLDRVDHYVCKQLANSLVTRSSN